MPALERFRMTLGPGLLWAAAAIGVSHLVQSTRAGADAGFGLVWVVLAALAFKYPFFEFGPRYAAATGESLVEGYRRLGRWGVWVYLLITLSTALIVQAAVVLFTTFLFATVLGVEWPIALTGTLVLGTCALILVVGRFRALDFTIKVVLVALAACTLAAAILMLPRIGEAVLVPWPAEGSADVGWVFVLALVGWMPSAIDISVWSSLWTLARNRSSGITATLRESLLDFRIGYVGTGLIALAFLTLGATVMYPADTGFSPEGGVFSLQLVDLYAATLGGWSRPVILVAVLTTMFSTSLTVMDGFPRAISRTVDVLRQPPADPGAEAPIAPGSERPLTPVASGPAGNEESGVVYWVALVVLASLTVIVFAYLSGSLTAMVDFATLVTFVTAPVLGYLNLRAVTAPHVPREARPGPFLEIFSRVGLAIMGGVALIFVVSLLV